MRNQKAWIVISVYLAVAVLLILFVLFLIKLLWAWTIPDLFPGAVSQGLVAARIGWLTAFKLSLFLGLLAGVAGAKKRNYRR